MTILLYDLCGADDRRFSPYCWRVKMALIHKGLAFETQPVPFTAIPGILGGGQKTVPVIDDGGTVVADSFEIARHLEAAYPDRPSLFGGPAGEAAARFVDAWSLTLHPILSRLVLMDIYERIQPQDLDYFRASREARFGTTIEAFEDKSEARIAEIRERLQPLRLMLRHQPFIGGAAPLYADYVVFGSLQWARLTSPVAILAVDDPAAAWFARCLDLFDGYGRRAAAA